MFATQRNDQISSKVLSADQSSPMIRRRRIAALTQHRARLLIGGIAHGSDGARTGHPHHISQTTLPQLLSEQRRSHHRTGAIETAYERDVQARATHNPYRFPSSAARSSDSSKLGFANARILRGAACRRRRHPVGRRLPTDGMGGAGRGIRSLCQTRPVASKTQLVSAFARASK